MEQAQKLNRIGEMFQYLGYSRKAIGYYQQALQRIADLKLSFPDFEARVNHNIAFPLYQIGQRTESITYYEKAIRLLRQAGLQKDVDGTTLVEIEAQLDIVKQGISPQLPIDDEETQMMLSQEKIELLVKHSIEVKTVAPQWVKDWRDMLEKERERYMTQQNTETAAFFDALLKVRSNGIAELPIEHPYQKYIQAVYEGIRQYQTNRREKPPHVMGQAILDDNPVPKPEEEPQKDDSFSPKPLFEFINAEQDDPNESLQGDGQETGNSESPTEIPAKDNEQAVAAEELTDVSSLMDLFNLFIDSSGDKNPESNSSESATERDDILPRESIDALIQDTIIVRAIHSDKADILRHFIIMKQQECHQRGVKYQHKATLLATLLVMLDGREVIVLDDNVYKADIEDALEQIKWLSHIIWNTVAVMTRFPDKKGEWQEKIEWELQTAFIQQQILRAAFLSLIHELVVDDIYTYPDEKSIYSTAWDTILNEIKNFHADKRLPLALCINKTIEVMVTNNVHGWDDWHKKISALLKFAEKRQHKHEIRFLQALLDILRSRPVRLTLGNRYEEEIQEIQREIQLYPIKEIVIHYLQSETLDEALEIYMDNRTMLSTQTAIEVILQFIPQVSETDKKAQMKQLLESLLRARQEEATVIATAFSQTREPDEVKLPSNKQYPPDFIEALYSLYIYHGKDPVQTQLKYDMGMPDDEIDYLIQLIESMLFN